MVNNIANYTKHDIARVFLNLEDKKGRKDLSKKLEIGEGTLRTILDILKQKKLIESRQQGHQFSKKGEKLCRNILKIIDVPKATSTSFYPGKKQVGVLLKNKKDIKVGIEKRDAAIRLGADGAIILKYNQKLYLPEFDYKSDDFKKLEEQFVLKNNNILIITFSDTLRFAEISAIACAAEINKDLKELIENIIN